MTDLVADFKRLRLYGMAACYAEGLEQSRPAMTTATAGLTHLVQAETTDRATRSVRYQLHAARFPIHRDLAGFDFTQAKVDRRQISTFATTSFTEQAENIVLIGGTGTGKTHLATALGIEAVSRHGKRARFYSTIELVNTLEQEKAGGRAGRLAPGVPLRMSRRSISPASAATPKSMTCTWPWPSIMRVLAVHVLHRDARAAVGVTHVVDAADVRMGNPTGRRTSAWKRAMSAALSSCA
jgi:hypothetical protein